MSRPKQTIIKILFAEQNGVCPYCEKIFNDTTEGTVDHVLPRSIFKGVKKNKVFCCKDCNSKKANIFICHTKRRTGKKLSTKLLMKMIDLQVFMLKEIGHLTGD